MKRNKYSAVKTVVDGYTFDSKREAAVYAELKLRERAGEISCVKVHPQYRFEKDDPDGLPVLIQKYKADFSFLELAHAQGEEPYWVERVVDVKSPVTAKKLDYIRTRKMMRAWFGIYVETIC